MSDSCEATSPFVLHSATTPAKKRHLYVHTAPNKSSSDSHAEDHQLLLVGKRSSYFAVKSAVDRTITAIFMVVALPLMLLIALVILLLDGRPILYRQKRVGKNGRVFRIWKFRTMCHDAESKTGAVWSSAGDPRVTALGRWLRCSHLDELPQFFNVLVGDMNLIGPRPERPEFVRQLVRELPSYRERLSVRPGITGLAQLHLGYDQSVADVRSKVVLDAEYIRTTGFFQDVKILLFTVPYIAMNLIHRWRSDSTQRSKSTDGGTVVPFGKDESPHARPRTETPSADDLEPRVVHFPEVSVGFGDKSFSARPAPLFITVDGVAQTADECQ